MPHTTTMLAGSTSTADCVCKLGYYDDIRIAVEPTIRVHCHACPLGAACVRAGVTLGHLPLAPGLYRPSALSIDVRRCPDAFVGCPTNSTCTRVSGCKGGDDPTDQCTAGLRGPFCLLCANGAGHYYSAATHSAPSSCPACDDTIASTLFKVFGHTEILSLNGILDLWFSLGQHLRRCMNCCRQGRHLGANDRPLL